MNDTDFVKPMYAAVDALDTEGMLSWLTDDASVRFGNAPALQGKDAIRASFASFFGMLSGIHHDMHALHRAGSLIVLEADVTYRVPGGREATVPAATFAQTRDGAVTELRVYVDLAPVMVIAVEAAPA